MSSAVYTGEEAKAYYVEEATYGTTPTDPAMLCIGVIQEIEPALDPRNIVLRGIGSRNVKAIRRGLRHIDLKVVYTPQNWNFFNYARSLKSTSVEVYYEKTIGVVSLNHKGCKVDRAKVEVSIEDPVKVTMDLIGKMWRLAQPKSEPATKPSL